MEVIKDKPSGAGNVKKKKFDNKKIKRSIAAVVALAIVGGISYGMYSLFHEEEVSQEAMNGVVMRSSIQSIVNGSGVAMPKDSATITLSADGKVTEVFVADGDLVNIGDPLYTIDSADAREAVESAQTTLENYEKQLTAIYDSYADLTVCAPFAGKIIDTADIAVGDDVGMGTTIAKLVDDKTLKLELYYSYAYENDIAVGNTVAVSIPATMSLIEGSVTKINYINRISPEGSALFSVEIAIDNPSTLSEDMGATAIMQTSSGDSIYPYEAGVLKYNRTADIITKTSGEAIAVNLLNYKDVSAGTVLLSMTADDNEDEIASLENSITEARANLEKMQQNLDDFNAVAPMSGTIQSCSLVIGEEVESGKAAISIADTTVMLVEAQIDALNVSNVKPNMYCDIVQWGRDGETMYMGIVDSVSLEGKYENGYSYFPAMIKVDNPDGTMMSGMYVDYSMIASQSEDCLVVPIQAVKYAMDGSACVFVQTTEAVENALVPEETGLDIPSGYIPVAVTVGLTDNFSAEIVSGLNEGDTIFTEYMQSGGNLAGMGMMMG